MIWAMRNAYKILLKKSDRRNALAGSREVGN